MNNQTKDQLTVFIDNDGNEPVFGLGQNLSSSLLGVIKNTLGIDLKVEEITFEHPKNPSFGDYSTNIALALTTNTKYQIPNTKPNELAKQLADEWNKQGLPQEVEKVETVGGFLNIWLNNEYLIKQLDEVLVKKDEFGGNESIKDKKILLEHTSPNPQTTIMLGHLRNNFLGMACANLLKNAGVKVTLDCVVNDRGVHICRSMWGYLVFAKKTDGLTKDQLTNFKEIDLKRSLHAILQGETLKECLWKEKLGQWINDPNDWWTPDELGLKSDHANLIWYVLGSRAYKEIEGIETQVHEILKEWETNDPIVRKLWKTIIGWSEEGYAETYRRVGSYHDKYWYESDHWQEGKDIVEIGLKKGVFKSGEADTKNGKQPIVTDLSAEGLPDTVVIKSDGTALYMTQDLALTRLKIRTFPSDLYIWDIGAEQTLYFQQLFAVADQLGLAKREQLYHLNYALINFKGGGKMATRRGDVVTADETLDLLKQRTLEIMTRSNQANREGLGENESEKLAETIAVGAVKFALLKYSRDTTIQFDIDESLSLTGNSGPYLQYTYTRTQSVLKKFKNQSSNIKTKFKINNSKLELNPEELALLRTIYKFPEVILQATKEFAPNLICNYLFDLAQKFNVFYDKHRILTTDYGLQTTADGQQTTDYRLRQTDNKKNSTSVDSSLNAVDGQSSFRLILTSAVGQIIKNGLTLLGINAPERM